MYTNPTLQMDRGHFLQDQIAKKADKSEVAIAELQATIATLSASVTSLDTRVTQQAARITVLELLCHKFKKKLHMENE